MSGTDGQLHRHAFPAMGSTVELTLAGPAGAALAPAARLAEELAAAWDATFSRFRPDSELARLNERAGERVVVAPALFAALDIAIAASRATGGLFDPTILPALIAHGYDRSFERLAGRADAAAAPGTAPLPGVAGIALDRRTRAVRLPRGVALDLGGVAKGLYADVLADALRAAGWRAGVVSAGGDLALWGDAPGGAGWPVGVEDPADPARDLVEIGVTAGGVATSGANRRHWRHASGEAHHLIDPRTGTPAASDVLTVTVVAPTASLAEVAATALFVGWDDADHAALAPLFHLALAVDRDGGLQTIQGTADVRPISTDAARDAA